MAYIINKTDGSIFASVSDGTTDSTSSVTLVGRNYIGFGEIQNENFIRLLENHSNSIAPSAPLKGQLWFDSTNSVLKVYNGTEFKSLGVAPIAATEPVTPTTGDMWYDITNKQLNVYNGTSYDIVGPVYTTTDGVSGPVIETVSDTIAVDHVITNLYVADELVAIMSDTAFTPSPAIPNFPTVVAGITLSSAASTVDADTFTGTAANAGLLDNLDSTQFLRSDLDDSTSGTLDIANDGGLTFGASLNGELSVTGINVSLYNNAGAGDLLLGTNGSTVITIDGTSNRARVGTPLTGIDIANRDYVDAAEASAIAGATQTASTVTSTATGNISATNVQAAIAELDTEKEPVFSKNTAFNKNFGTTAGTVAEGNHTHGIDKRSGYPAVKAYKTSNGTGGVIWSTSPIHWHATKFDNDGWWLGGTDHRLVVPSTIDGNAITGAQVTVSYSVNCNDFGWFEIRFYDLSAGTDYLVHRCNPEHWTSPSTSMDGKDFSGTASLITCAPGDYFYVLGYPNLLPITSITYANDMTWMTATLEAYW